MLSINESGKGHIHKPVSTTYTINTIIHYYYPKCSLRLINMSKSTNDAIKGLTDQNQQR
jgi:hypothetical protein